METMQSINLISTNPRVRNGRPCIAGTTLEVAVIAIAKVVGGQGAEEIAADYGLSLSQVYAALAYYYENKEKIDATIQQRRQLAESMKEARVGSRHHIWHPAKSYDWQLGKETGAYLFCVHGR